MSDEPIRFEVAPPRPNTVCECVRVVNSTDGLPRNTDVLVMGKSASLGRYAIVTRSDCPKCGGNGR